MSDAARTGDLEAALRAVVPALDAHLAAPATGTASGADASWRPLLDTPVPQLGAGDVETLRVLAETVVPDAMRMTAPGFLGWITTGSTVVPAVARLVATLAGTQRYLGHTTGLLESVALRWLAETCQLPPEMEGVFSSSGSVANLLAIGAARQRAYTRLGHDVARDGVRDVPPGRIYASVEVHHCVLKAAAVLGLGRDAVALLPVDGSQRVDLSAVRAALSADARTGVVPVAVLGIAGTTNTGAIDDLDGLADLAQEFGTWLHVDGAYGLFGRLDPRLEARYTGVDRADSVVVDAHKWLCVPTGIGATFLRDRAALGQTFTSDPSDYLEGAFEEAGDTSWATSPWEAMGPPFHDWTLDLSAPARGLVVWSALHEIGVEGLRARIVRDNDYARSLAELVRADPCLELLAEPELSICCFRYRAHGLDEATLDALNRDIVRRLHGSTPYVPSPTLVDGHYAIRPCFINPRTEQRDVSALAATVRRLGDALVAGAG
ncbi:MAG: aromatic-L-amino-acid/L-tryptophan decarboxylase [Actinomycetota bacterium]|jgi:aromatic-L-amino-acid decarboxylase|nr:aromatic-L-amino-acid/L-tryptophan decarboxylase [Actinomycetota bacterium]